MSLGALEEHQGLVNLAWVSVAHVIWTTQGTMSQLFKYTKTYCWSQKDSGMRQLLYEESYSKTESR